MKLDDFTNTSRGYDMGRRANPWWQHPAFPLLPQFQRSAGDEWNTGGWFFGWLWLRMWTLDFFSLELAVELEDTGLNIRAILGWLRIVIRIVPMPEGWLRWLRREPRGAE